jgi:hypothetical protein
VVRIIGFHPIDPGSSPGEGVIFFGVRFGVNDRSRREIFVANMAWKKGREGRAGSGAKRTPCGREGVTGVSLWGPSCKQASS